MLVSGTTESTVPYSVAYQDMILSVETAEPDGTWKVQSIISHTTRLRHAFME